MAASERRPALTQVVEIAWADAAGMEAIFQIRDEVFVDEQALTDDARHDPDDLRSIHYLALRDRQPIGTGRLTRYHHEAQIAWVAVRQPWRGSGVGGALMQAMLERGARDGATYALLNAQTHAQTFYEQLGFEAIGDVFYMSHIAHIVMVKRLDPSPSLSPPRGEERR